MTKRTVRKKADIPAPQQTKRYQQDKHMAQELLFLKKQEATYA